MTGGSRPPTRHVDRPKTDPDFSDPGPFEKSPSRPGQRPSVGGMRRGLRWIVLLVCVLGWIAASPSPAEARDSPARKLGRGFANLGLGVLTMPAEVVETGRRHGPFVAATWGLVKGVTLTAVTEVVGLWEILTAPYPFPPEFKPILAPEFPWQRFEAESRRESLEQRPPPRVR